MIKNILFKIQQKILSATLLEKHFGKLAIALLFLFCAACTDQGCIEADDFGEYESQTIEVAANPSEDSCKYDITAALDDSSAQGSVVRACFTTGRHSVDLGDGSTANSDPGCNHFRGDSAATYQNICVTNCINKCLSDQTFSTTGAVPTWTATDKKDSSLNSGVTIRPGSQVMVRATGLIVLGDKASYPDAHIPANNPYLNYGSSTRWSPVVLDVKSGQTVNVSFSGKARINSTPVEYLGSGSESAYGNDIAVANNTYNAARRIVAYTIPHPSGYSYDSTKADKERYPSVNLFPDTDAWRCIYKLGGEKTESTCRSLSYSDPAVGYPSANSTADTYPIDSINKSQGLGSYGGMIRWSTDGLKPEQDSDNPFITNSVNCKASEGSCTNIASISPDVGQVLGDPGVGNSAVIMNPYTNYAAQVSFSSLLADDAGVQSNGCNVDNISISILAADSENTVIASKNIKIGSRTFLTRSSLDNSEIEIPLEPRQKISIPQITQTFNGVNCGRYIVVRFNKYHDIKLNKSGFVRFTMLNSGSTSQSCRLRGRIINPSNAYPFSDDFYEYDSFLNNTSNDPLGGTFSVPPSPTGASRVWSNNETLNNTTLFVRKGQVIRLSPKSWNGAWTSDAGERQCGVGMAMYIDERPAILCKNIATDRVANPKCTPEMDGETGSLVGCQEFDKRCSESSSTAYCPEPCQGKITCTTNGNDGNSYTKTGCPASVDVLQRKDPTNCTSATYDSTMQASCSLCNGYLLTNVKQPALVPANLYQCYDLENYSGRVSDIPSSGLATAYRNKGATPLKKFNGTYGNLENFSETTEKDTAGNVVYKLKSSFTFSQAGRLYFMVIDGDDFKNIKSAYSDNGGDNGSNNYDGSNGFKINLSGTLQFSNGQWLEARICKEDSSGSDAGAGTKCRSTALKLSGQPSIVDIEDPLPGNVSDPVITSEYIFDDAGNLVRKTPLKSQDGDCTSSSLTPEITAAGSNFYCHTYKYFTSAQMSAKSKDEQSSINDDISNLRLTFKIKDPENPSNISGTGLGSGCHIPKSSSDTSTTIDGIRQSNPNYRNDCKMTASATANNGYLTVGEDGESSSCVTNASNTGALCGYVDPNSTIPCRKEFYCASVYGNNSGKYAVNIKIKNQVGNGVSNIIDGVIKPIVSVMDGPPINCNISNPSSTIGITFDGTKTTNPNYDDSVSNNRNAICTSATDATCEKQYICSERTPGQAEKMYRMIIKDSIYQTLLSAFLGVMITFYGFGYLMGVSNLSQQEILGRVIKIGLIYLFVGDAGWEWFNKIVVHFFKDGTDYLAFMMASSFDNSTEITQSIQNGDYYDKSILFSSVDRVFGIFFSQAIQKKISALLFASIFGWVYLIIIYFSFLLYIYAVANAVLLYLTAQVFISILFILGPIFFLFTLFAQTKDMFENWLKQLIGFSLQQIFLLTTLAFFNMLMYEVIKMAFGFKICWDDVWTIHLFGAVRITLLSFWTVASLPPRTSVNTDVGNIGNPDGIPSLFSILFIWVVASLMNKFITFMTDLGSSLGGGLSLSALSSGVKEAAKGLEKGAKSLGAKAWKKTGGRVLDSIDDALFDSGETADKRREEKKKKANEDKNNRASMSRAADEAERKYKRENMAEFSSKSKEEQRKIIKGVRYKAMTKRGKELGLNDEQIENLFNSLNEQNADNQPKVSKKDLSKSMEGMNKQQREETMTNVKSGQLQVEKSTSEKVASGAKSILGGAARAIASPMKTARSIGNSIVKKSSYNQARNELISEGALPYTAGPSALNKVMDSDATKKKIRAREREMLAETRVEKTKVNPSTLAKMKKKHEKLTALEKPEADKDKGIRAEGTLMSKIFGREKKLVPNSFSPAYLGGKVADAAKAVWSPQKTARNRNATEKQEVRDTKKASITTQLKAAQGQRETLTKAQEANAADRKAIANSPVADGRTFATAQKEVATIQARMKEKGKSKPTKKEKKELLAKQRAITADPKYKAATAQMSGAEAVHNQNRNKLKHVDERADKLKAKKLKMERDEFFDNYRSEGNTGRRGLNDVQKYFAKTGIATKETEAGKAAKAWSEYTRAEGAEPRFSPAAELRKAQKNLKNPFWKSWKKSKD